MTLVGARTGSHCGQLGLCVREFRPELLSKHAMFQPHRRPLSRIASQFVEAFRQQNSVAARWRRARRLVLAGAS